MQCKSNKSNNINKVSIDGKFIKDGNECILLSGEYKDRTIIVEYMDDSTGEVLEIGAHELDDTTAMNICIQFENKTGIEIDYRNLNTI